MYIFITYIYYMYIYMCVCLVFVCQSTDPCVSGYVCVISKQGISKTHVIC